MGVTKRKCSVKVWWCNNQIRWLVISIMRESGILQPLLSLTSDLHDTRHLHPCNPIILLLLLHNLHQLFLFKYRIGVRIFCWAPYTQQVIGSPILSNWGETHGAQQRICSHVWVMRLMYWRFFIWTWVFLFSPTSF